MHKQNTFLIGFNKDNSCETKQNVPETELKNYDIIFCTPTEHFTNEYNEFLQKLEEEILPEHILEQLHLQALKTIEYEDDPEDAWALYGINYNELKKAKEQEHIAKLIAQKESK